MDLVERLRARLTRCSPRRVVVVVPDRATARWIQSLLVDGGPVVGARILDIEGLLAAAARELLGDPLPPTKVLAEVREALAGADDDHFARILDQPSYQRAVLRTFVTLERSLEASDSTVEPLALAGDDRDRAVLAAFERFRRALARAAQRSSRAIWWRGQDVQRVIAGHDRVGFLRRDRRAEAIAIGFAPVTTPRWQDRVLDAIGCERWLGGWAALDDDSNPAASERRPVDARLSCAGPEAEIAAVARILRGAPSWRARLNLDRSGESGPRAAVLAPASAVPRWVARLGHRDVPVRAWVQRRITDTATAGCVRALTRTLGDPLRPVARADLDAILFGPNLRAWASAAEEAGLDFPRSPRPGDLRAVWAEQRATALSLTTLRERLVAGGARSLLDALDIRSERFGWGPERLEARRRRIVDAHALLVAAVERLLAITTAAELAELLDDWGLVARAAARGPGDDLELQAARVVLDCVRRRVDDDTPVDALAVSLDHALEFAGGGRWTQTRSIDGPEAIWVLPYAAAAILDPLPPLVVATGLDAHPRPPTHRGMLSATVGAALGLPDETARFSADLRQLDRLVDGRRRVLASWRHRTGTGSPRPPGPWIAGRQRDGGAPWVVGVDGLSLPTDGTPSTPREAAIAGWREQPELARRVRAMQAHEARAPAGPHTGRLDVAVPPSRPYSASALQRFAALPYRYFLERLLGLREPATGTPSGAALLATEQGEVVHRALEAALGQALERQGGRWLDMGAHSKTLLDAALDALAEGYRRRAEHGQAEALWTSERDRWTTELGAWWSRWHERVAASYSTSASASGRWRKPPESTIPGRVLVAVEWSPPGESFELDLGWRTLPFVAAVDRIEADPPRQRFVVCDYKTGAPRPPWAIASELRAGTHLQLPLYAMTVEQSARADPTRWGPNSRVGALRLEYLRRPTRWFPRGRASSAQPEARAFDPDAPLGVDAAGREWTVRAAAAFFAAAFATAIETGVFPLVERAGGPRFRGVDRMRELMRVVPAGDGRPGHAGGEGHADLPPPLAPFAEPRRNREVVR